MKAHYTIKPRADRDLDEYGDYLSSEAGVDTALRFFDAAQRTFALLASQPNMGWQARIKYPGLESLRVFRVAEFEHVLIFYRPLGRGVEILRLVHGSRNLRELLHREGLE